MNRQHVVCLIIFSSTYRHNCIWALIVKEERNSLDEQRIIGNRLCIDVTELYKLGQDGDMIIKGGKITFNLQKSKGSRMCYLQSARSSAQFHGEHEVLAGAALPPWTGSLCEQQGSPRCWRIKPTRCKKYIKCVCVFLVYLLILILLFCGHVAPGEGISEATQ